MFMFVHVNSFTSFVIYQSRIHCKPERLAGWLVCLFVLFIALKCNGTQAIVLTRSHSHTNTLSLSVSLSNTHIQHKHASSSLFILLWLHEI